MTLESRGKHGRLRRHGWNQRVILMISALDFTAGDVKGMPSVKETIHGYVDRGWKVLLITGTRRPEGAGPPVEGVEVSRFDAPWLKRGIRHRTTVVKFAAKACWWLWFQVMAFIEAQGVRRRCRPDVVYGATTYGVPVGKLLSRLWRVPFVSRFHGTVFFMPSHMERKFWRLRSWDFIVAYRIPTDLVIMTNDGTQGDRVLERMGVDAERIRFWMNGIDRQLFASRPPKMEARQRLNIAARHVLLTVSRLVTSKRVDRVIEALPRIVREFPDAVLILVGDGADRARLERLTHDLRVERNVRFEGMVPHKHIPLYMATADIFLSMYDLSNVGNPLLEAMMAGRCVVTLNNGDTGRYIENGENGVLLEEENLSELPAVVNELLTDQSLRERLGANAREFAEENFWTWQERMDAEVAAVSSLLEQQSHGEREAR